MIRSSTSEYITPPHCERANAIGHYFPDAIIDAISALSENASILEKETPVLRDIPLTEAIQHITAALNAFDPSLGEQAAAILNDRTKSDGLLNQGQRLNIREIPGQPLRVMGVRAAGLREEDAMVHPDAEKAAQIAEHFPEIENNRPYAIIDYEYNGSLESVVYLAHEVGHAIADGRQNDADYTYRDNPVHMAETQAYFTQAIFTNYLSSLSSSDPNLAHAAQVFRQNHRAENTRDFNTAFEQQSKRLHDRAPNSIIAEQLVKHLEQQTPETTRATTNMLMGGQGPLEINAVLSRAGVETVEHLQRMLEKPTAANATSQRPNMLATLSPSN